VDDTPLGRDVVEKLKNHKVNTDYMLTIPDGMGTWLAVFDNNGDLAGSISKRPVLLPIYDLLEEKGDEILGFISFMDINHLNCSAELRIIIGNSENRGRGVGTFAVKAIIAHAFNNMNLHHIEFGVL
jgi:RimJ/RimL family protein N-acetyltransferase